MYSFVFWCAFIVLVDFRLHCIATVTPPPKEKTMNTHQNTKEYIKGRIKG